MASAGVPTASADFRSGYNRWKKSPAMGVEWDGGLNNGTEVWDNVWYQNHNFVRVSDDSWEIFDYPGLQDGRGGIFAITSYGPPSNQYIKFDSQENWLFNIHVSCPSTAVDLWSIAAHEHGHGLVIDDKTAPSYATMYQYYGYGRDDARSLEAEDRGWIQALYPCPACRGF